MGIVSYLSAEWEYFLNPCLLHLGIPSQSVEVLTLMMIKTDQSSKGNVFIVFYICIHLQLFYLKGQKGWRTASEADSCSFVARCRKVIRTSYENQNPAHHSTHSITFNPAPGAEQLRDETWCCPFDICSTYIQKNTLNSCFSTLWNSFKQVQFYYISKNVCVVWYCEVIQMWVPVCALFYVRPSSFVIKISTGIDATS